MLGRAVLAFANILQRNHCGRYSTVSRGGFDLTFGRHHGKSHSIPGPFPGQPAAVRRVAEIAKLLHRLEWWDFALMSRRRAKSAPATSQRESGGMLPCPILELLY